MKKLILKLTAVFGFLYFLLNIVILVNMIALTALASARTGTFAMTLDGIFFLFPVLGMLAGWWIRHRRFGVLRSLIIFVSLLITAGTFYMALVVSPKLENLQQEKVSRSAVVTPAEPATQEKVEPSPLPAESSPAM